MATEFFDLYPLRTNSMNPRKVKLPSYRHGSPSGPWPFLDLNDTVDQHQLASSAPPRRQDEEQDEQEDWAGYPQSLFPNWTQFQQMKSGISKVVNRKAPHKDSDWCMVHKLDVWDDGTFHGGDMGTEEAEEGVWDWVVKDGEAGKTSRATFWDGLREQPSSQVGVRALFVENMSGPVLQMLGTKFNVEPFFFSSSLNCIPSRYQSQIQPGVGDHITIILPFIRTLPNPSTMPPSAATSYAGSTTELDFDMMAAHAAAMLQDQVIDTQGPLKLHSNAADILMPDLLAFHIIRRSNTPNPSSSTSLKSGPQSPPVPGNISTIISFHPPSAPPYRSTSASALHSRLLAAGHSVYWSKIFSATASSGDPTFVALSLLWYAMYAWDEALEVLVGEVVWLESQTLSTLPHPGMRQDAHVLTHRLTHQLHVVRAHLLHYEGVLHDFRKSVTFLLATPHPGLQTTPLNPSSSNVNSGSPSEYVSNETSDTVLEHHLEAIEEEIVVEGTFYDDSDEDEPVIHAEQTQSPESEGQSAKPTSEPLLKKECTNLLSEIDRLEMTRRMLDKRLGNVMGLAFSSVNIEDSKRMSEMTEAAVRDSAAMKQIAYLTMIFLPASFVAGCFGMNIPNLTEDGRGTLPHYFATAIPLTVVTVWVMMFQYQHTKRKAAQAETYGLFGNVVSETKIPKPSGWMGWMTWPTGSLAKKFLLSPWWNRRTGRSKSRPNSTIGGSRASSRRRRARAPARSAKAQDEVERGEHAANGDV